MKLFNPRENTKLKNEIAKKEEFKLKNYKLEIISAKDDTIDYNKLLDIKILFQKMLPKMPKEYIMRQLLDKKQCSLSLLDENEDLIGAVCYRPFYENNFLEIVFFAVNSLTHIKGYGTFLMNCLKEIVKRQYIHFVENQQEFMNHNITINNIDFMTANNITYNSDIFKKTNEHFVGQENAKRIKKEDIYNKNTQLYFMTYADNSAVGFFKKQGFDSEIVSTMWKKHIKDYDGGTLMECKIYEEINYLNQMELILKLSDQIFEKMKKINEYHIIRAREDSALVNLKKEAISQTKSGFLENFINYCISELYASPSSWPFLEPVSAKDVPDYFTIIKRPMDLSKIKHKYIKKEYNEFFEFREDVMLMINNCKTFNASHTQYYKCAENIEARFHEICDLHKMTINKFIK
ncbi:GCN5 [Ecytonucleospora hepatopenaei]|uniref:histone acetyltransferase n=1 Tax=Ecytonucleospora hepatopenaei TaxID=646526 RepID=A0A1W0E609_9MICR|nr:GCN5 [Ecytonucleospora hepatopenaei]